MTQRAAKALAILRQERQQKECPRIPVAQLPDEAYEQWQEEREELVNEEASLYYHQFNS